MSKKKQEDGELRAWRASHFDELEATLNVLRSIRDASEVVDVKCPACKKVVKMSFVTAKDKIEASKGIGRLLSAMSPDKIAVTASEEKNSASVSRRNIPTLSPALKAKLASVLNHAPQ